MDVEQQLHTVEVDMIFQQLLLVVQILHIHTVVEKDHAIRKIVLTVDTMAVLHVVGIQHQHQARLVQGNMPRWEVAVQAPYNHNVLNNVQEKVVMKRYHAIRIVLKVAT